MLVFLIYFYISVPFLSFCSFSKNIQGYVRVGAKEGWLKFVLQNGHALVVLSSLNDVATSKFQGPTSCVVSWKP